MTTKNDEILGVWSELFVGHALAIQAVEGAISGHTPLSIAEYDVLLSIKRSPNRSLRFSALAEAVIYTKSGITRLVKRLEGEGYVKREACLTDKRVTYAVLTEAGDHALQETWRWYSQAVLRIMTPCFSLQEAQALREMLGRIVEKLSRPSLITIGKERSSNRTK